VLQDVLTRLDRAFQPFFRRVETSEKPGYPRFRGANRYNSFAHKQFANRATRDNGFLVLSEIGPSTVRWSRPIEGTPKTVTASREADGRYVCCSCADVVMQPFPATGLHLGLEAFAKLSNGERIVYLGRYRKTERRLKTAQRRVSRRTKGGRRRHEAVTLLAKAHQQVRRHRPDLHHNVALRLGREHDAFSHEDMQTANTRKNHHLAESIDEAGWSQFLRILRAKAARAGRTVMAVPPAPISQTCSGCGIIVSKGPSVRWPMYPSCGTSLHRDVNIAKNRERLGQGLRGVVA
jgi:putative transposase